MESLPEVTLVTRRGCHLCEEARAVLEKVRGDHPFQLAVRDLDSDPSLPSSWSEELPVVLVDGKKRFKVRIAERRLRRLLGRASRHRAAESGNRA